MRRTASFTAIIAITALAGCGGSASNASTKPTSQVENATTAGATVGATVSDFKIVLDKASAQAGKIAVSVDGGGPSTHELVAFKTELPEDKLPIDASIHKVDEAASTVQHFSPEAENIAKGGHKTVVLDLSPGKYVFICNIPGHYSLGMHVAFEATAPQSAASSTSTNAVNATVKDFEISLDKQTASAGKVTVNVAGKGPSEHELVAFKTDLPVDGLPIDAALQKVDEAASTVQHFSPEAEKIGPGMSKSITLDLPPGKYVFICNIPGHYKLGMHAAFTVT